VVLVVLGLEDVSSLFSLASNSLTTFVGHNFDLSNFETWESLFTVGNVETTVASTLHGTKCTVTS
jgi:hypothetical protein